MWESLAFGAEGLVGHAACLLLCIGIMWCSLNYGLDSSAEGAAKYVAPLTI